MRVQISCKRSVHNAVQRAGFDDQQRSADRFPRKVADDAICSIGKIDPFTYEIQIYIFYIIHICQFKILIK